MNLKIKDLTKEYKDFKLNNINFEIKDGSIMGFVGANGAGKSTTIKLILDLVNKNSGEILFDGKEINKEIKENLGVVFDESNFPKTMNPIEINNLYKKIYKNHNPILFFKYLEKFGINKYKKIETFSKGMKMKLNIALALSHKAKMLILDEATTGLDPLARNQVLDILSDFISNKNNSILISSHIISDLEKLCDTITYIDDGQILFSENKIQFLSQYKCLETENIIKFENLKKLYKYHKIRNTYYFLLPIDVSRDCVANANTIGVSNYYSNDCIIRNLTIEDLILITGGHIK